jgi:type I restriction enzyme M protein
VVFEGTKVLSELDKVNKAHVTVRLKEIKGDKEAKVEAAVLNDWLKLNTHDTLETEC